MIMKTAVFPDQNRWWFRWRNVAEAEDIHLSNGKPKDVAEMPLPQRTEGPFLSKEEAELAREKFVKARREKYPFILCESE